jgi:hypothetical protein
MLDFLTTATVLDVAEIVTVRKSTSGPRKERNPLGLAIRVFRDGSVYPSQALVDTFNLDYPTAVVSRELISSEGEETKFKLDFKVSGHPGNGFDIIDTDKAPFLSFGKRILVISPIQRDQPKVDLFAQTSYDETGLPKSNVIDQGAKSYGTDYLIPAIEEIYGIAFAKRVEGSTELTPGVEFVDMVLVANPNTNAPWTLPKGKEVAFIPKQFVRGKDKGQYTVIRRENPVFYAFLPMSLIGGNEAENGQSADNEGNAPSSEETAVSAEIADAIKA